MFEHVRRSLTTRRDLWAAAFLCAALAALPGSLLALVFVRAATMFVLSGDAVLALDVIPDLRRPEIIAALIGGGSLAVLIFNRLYAALIWSSDDRTEPGWNAAWSATKRSWLRLLALNLRLAAVLVAGAAGLLITILSLRSNPGTASFAFLLGVTLLLFVRTVGRIFVTLAARAAILDELGVQASWTAMRKMFKERRRDVVAAWAMLLATGAAVWLGGRVVSPILQDTTLDLPAFSGYALAREGAQLAFAIPIEAFLLALSATIWTAVYRDLDTERSALASRGGDTRSAAGVETTPSLLPRALAAVTLLTVIGNGIPAVADVAWRNTLDENKTALREEESTPEDAVQGGTVVGDPIQVSGASHVASSRTTYEVDASLDGDILEWSTRLEMNNRFDRDLDTLPLHVYPAAFDGPIEELPLADDVLTTSVRGHVEAGTLAVLQVRDASGRELEHELDGTTLRIDLQEPVRPRERFAIRIDLRAELPHWPARFGVWRDKVQLGNWIPTVPPIIDGRFRVHPYFDVGDPFFAEVSDYRVDLKLEESMGAVGSGKLARIDATRSDDTWTFSGHALRDAAFVVARGLRSLQAAYPGGTVRVWYTGDGVLEAREVLDDARSVLTDLSGRYGRLVADELDIVLNASTLGGMEYPGLIFVSVDYPGLEGIPLLPDLVEHVGFNDELRSYITGHEIAHQWWYSEVGNDQALEPWLDEAFAEVSTRSWLLGRDGDELVWKIAHLERAAEPEVGSVDASVLDFDDNSDYSDTIYLGGGEVLMELRALLGVERFDDLLQRWHDGYRGKTATIDRFVTLTEEIGGKEAKELLLKYKS